MMIKRSEGFTLAELIVSIAIGTIITGAVLSILLFGMRINAKTADNVRQQNEANMLAQIIQTVSEKENIAVQNDKIVLLQFDDEGNIQYEDGKPLISQTLIAWDGNKILLNNETFMEDVNKISVTADSKKLVTLQIWMGENNAESPDYSATIYCRLMKEVPTNEP